MHNWFVECLLLRTGGSPQSCAVSLQRGGKVLHKDTKFKSEFIFQIEVPDFKC